MLRVDVKQARAGMSLALPVQNPAAPSRILLRVGYDLNDEVIARLKELGVRHVWVKYPSLKCLEKIIDPQLIRKQSEVVGKIADTFEAMQGQSSAKLKYNEYTQAIAGLVEHMIGNPQSAVFLGDIAADSNELMRHSSAVTYLALLMGLKLEGYIVRERRHIDPHRAKELNNLGLGAMLHDIGATLLPEPIRERFNQAGDESDPEYREHTALGFEMVRGQVDPTAANALLHHHQRFDGSGFTGSNYNVLDGKRVHVFARIVSLADAFDALRRPMNAPPRPQVWALSQLIHEPTVKKFDPRTITALLAVAPPYPQGSTVRLSDGQWAVCIDHNPHRPCRPTVQFIPDPNELSPTDNDEPGDVLNLDDVPDELYVAQADDTDVSELNFDLPTQFAEPHAVSAWL